MGFNLAVSIIKEYNGKDWIHKKKWLLAAKGGKYYQSGTEGDWRAYCDLIRYYRDPHDALKRLYDGYHDSMFVRLAIASGMFTTRVHWEMAFRDWDFVYSKVIWQYNLSVHKKYDSSTGLPYTSFFDTHFSRLFNLRLMERQFVLREDLDDAIELIRLDQIRDSKYGYNDPNLYEDLSYELNDYDVI